MPPGQRHAGTDQHQADASHQPQAGRLGVGEGAGEGCGATGGARARRRSCPGSRSDGGDGGVVDDGEVGAGRAGEVDACRAYRIRSGDGDNGSPTVGPTVGVMLVVAGAARTPAPLELEGHDDRCRGRGRGAAGDEQGRTEQQSHRAQGRDSSERTCGMRLRVTARCPPPCVHNENDCTSDPRFPNSRSPGSHEAGHPRATCQRPTSTNGSPSGTSVCGRSCSIPR